MKRVTAKHVTARRVTYACAVVLTAQLSDLARDARVMSFMIFLAGLAVCTHYLWSGRHYTIARLRHGGYRADCRECVDNSTLIVFGRDLLETLRVAHTHHRNHANTIAENTTREK